MISLIVVTSLFIIGLHYCMQFDLIQNSDSTSGVQVVPANKEIFWFIKYYAHAWFSKTSFSGLLKPLCDCPVCMSSIYGSVMYWLDFHYSNDVLNTHTILLWGVFLVAVAGLNRLLYKFLIS